MHHGRGWQTWLDWDAGRRVMPAASWELYLLRTGKNPELIVQALVSVEGLAGAGTTPLQAAQTRA